jgi:hypothetical protein
MVLDEPWVVAPDDPACRSAMAGFYRESRQRYPRTAAGGTLDAVHRSCLTDNSAAVTADDYRGAVSAIERAEGIRVIRLEGYSFASVRAAYLGTERPDLIAAVGSPFPVGAKAADFHSAQGAAARSVRRSGPGSGWSADSALAYYTITGTPPGDMAQETAARGLWRATGDGYMSLSRVGYYSELCGALTGWDDFVGAAHQAGSAVTALASVHAPCVVAEQSTPVRLPVKTCFAILAADPNSPWVPSPMTRGVRIETVTEGQHGKVRIPTCQ